MIHRLVLAALAAPLLAADPTEFFEMKVRPVLARNCFSCHTQTKMGGLEMSSRESMMKGGKRGPAVMANDPERSLLIQAVRQTGDLKMPPSGKLAPAEVDDLVAWVRDGAVWPSRAPVTKGPVYQITPEQRAWWSFQPIRKPTPPKVVNTAWARTDLDRLVLAVMEARGLAPVPPADRRSLIRRVYYDLTGLPPNSDEVEAFLADRAPDAYAKVVDSLLRSPHYGERWGRYWLDVARYSDDKLNSTQDDPYPNAWRYRDWVIKAFNDDMPYNLFLKAQIAGDQLPDKERLAAGTGFFALSPEFQDDRVDVATRGFMGLTVACAQCHDHKFDPIPQRDFYALSGVFGNSAAGEWPLAPEAEVKEFKARKERVEKKQKEIDDFLDRQGEELAWILASQSAHYLRAAREGKDEAEGLDKGTLGRWRDYLKKKDRETADLEASPDKFQEKLLAVLAEKKRIDDVNHIRLGGSDARRDLANADLLSLPRNDYVIWRDVANGVLLYKGDKVERFLAGQWETHLKSLRGALDKLKKEMPAQYAFYHVMKDNAQFKNERLRIRGARDNPGEEVPRSFVSILSKGPPTPFKGGGRLELAEAVGDDANPLPARVIANRVWMGHFGAPLVATPSNFGQLGAKPTHPELLDHLAARLVESGWSLKALHREILLSSVYQLGNRRVERNFAADPDNTTYWRANRRRLDIEPLRDTMLALTGELDRNVGGPPVKLTEESNNRRSVYGFVSRRKMDGTLALFDFPNPNNHSEQRIETATPLQQLFFLNSGFVQARAAKLAARLRDLGTDDTARIKAAYRLLFARQPDKREIDAGVEYLRSENNKDDAWPRYAQVLLCSNELLFVN